MPSTVPLIQRKHAGEKEILLSNILECHSLTRHDVNDSINRKTSNEFLISFEMSSRDLSS